MKKQKTDQSHSKLTRRQLLKLGTVSCVAASFGGLGLERAFRPLPANAQPKPLEEKILTSACLNNCGSSCVLKPVVADGKVIRIETDNAIPDNWEEGLFQIRACPRGRSMRRQMYAENRLKKPMKQFGKRGDPSGFKPIPWDQALDEIAASLKKCIDTYGNESILSIYASGVQTGMMQRREAFYRLMNLLGGFALGRSDYSSAQNQAGLTYLYGQAGYSGNPVTEIANTKLAVFFGLNTTETRMSGGGLQFEILKAKQISNARLIVIDPRYSETCVTVADEWIPIRPGTDAALASALAYVLITENMLDNEFLKTHVQGFDADTMPEGAPENSAYKDYIMGTGYDKIAKTPEWAAQITGIPVARIIQLAREIGGAKPCFISQGWGLQRQAAGEMSTMSVAALATVTGNVGIHGGGNGDRDAYYPGFSPRLPRGDNKVSITFPTFLWLRAVENGKGMTATRDGVKGADKYPTDIKFIWNYAGNTLVNQHSDINETRRILGDKSKCEMIVVMDTHDTASAQWADILLPSTSYLEQTDIVGPSYAMNIDWLGFTTPVTPYEQSRPVYEVCVELAKRLGVEKEFTEGKTREQWLEWSYETQCRPFMPELPPTLEEARKVGVWRKAKLRSDLPIPFKAFRDDPQANPLKTPSGKIELFSPALLELSKTWELNKFKGDVIPPTPQYVSTWEGYEDTETKKLFPLQLIGHHYKGRTHSHYASVDWLLAVMPQNLWINPIDAKARGLRHGDTVKVLNKRGEVHIKVKVTKRIMPGVVSMPQGAWYNPESKNLDQNKNPIDQGGCVNTLTLYRASPLAKGNPQHTNLVEVVKL
ncbi:DMSO/selenate family reductase complex A subunit [Desulfovibrio litoralis]|uniref:Anaerobic dimethyl sulfoxide reductase subunit A n=1 Tax=Desulfovibrio litoralis DSM 11393 TaxID=1121455 RepID=A0A1M7TCJ5_9BACT|nr:DMSO/selenate family reductase complex A subunit [Desulfovibrio litoralis]SHN68489.1 anaerobic dimethyl sulfoxide reductase subunit A [Desulfovibrio litoralis DSM 11393]